jgi:hypothetical protein
MTLLLVWIILNGVITKVPIEDANLPRENLYGEFGDNAVLYLYNLSWGVRKWDIYVFKKLELVGYQRIQSIGENPITYEEISLNPSNIFKIFPTWIRMGGECKVQDGDVMMKKKLKPLSSDFKEKLANPFE